MAKMITMLFILIALQASMIIYYGQDATPTSLWDFVTGMSNWGQTSFTSFFVIIAASIAMTGISTGGTFKFVTNFISFSVAIGSMFGIGIIFTNLGNHFNDFLIENFFTACPSASSCSPSLLISAIIIGPFALYYIWTVLAWWIGNDS